MSRGCERHGMHATSFEADQCARGDNMGYDDFGDREAARENAANAAPWDEVFDGKPDLIASGRNDNSAVLFRMSRLHANVLGAYLNGRNDIAPLPPLVVEVLDALTLRLVQPRGSRWADLRRALAGQPVLTPEYEERFKQEQQAIAQHGYVGYVGYAGRRRRDVGDPSDLRTDLRDSQVELAASEAGFGEALLGDVDGTTVDEMLGKEEK